MKAIKIGLSMLATAAFFAAGCNHKGKPNQHGQLLTMEQIKALKDNQSMNGKLVTIEGYAGVCGSMFVTADKKNDMDIYANGFCEGEKLITAKIEFSGNTTPIGGEELRNYAEAAQSFENKSIKFMTDTYESVPNSKLKFSGTLVYNGSNYYLDNVIIYK